MHFEFLNNYKFIPFAHRGGSLESTENTLDSFQHSINLGYEYIETDVRHTRDNKLVVFHDEDLKRLCNEEIKISDMEYEDLKKIKIKKKHYNPLLDEVLTTWPNINFNIEPKTFTSAKLLSQSLKKIKNINRFCIGSFSFKKLEMIRNNVGVKLCTSMTKSETIKFYLKQIIPLSKINIPCLQIPSRYMGFKIITKSIIDKFHNQNKKVHVWTVNDENEINELIDIGVDGIMTDKPTLLKRILKSRSLWKI